MEHVTVNTLFRTKGVEHITVHTLFRTKSVEHREVLIGRVHENFDIGDFYRNQSRNSKFP